MNKRDSCIVTNRKELCIKLGLARLQNVIIDIIELTILDQS